MNNKVINFYKIPLKTTIEEVRKALISDDGLEEAVQNYSEELTQDNIEIWGIEKNMIITENGYMLALYQDEKDLMSTTQQYIDLCEKTIKHLIGVIQIKKLQEHFSVQVLQDALTIKNIHINKDDGK